MTPLRKDRQTFRLGTNSGGRFGDCGRGNSIRDVFFGCDTRHHRQREGFNCGFPSGLRSACSLIPRN